uniref:phosphatidate phosphatase n=1 Tax=Kwoniella dejecticola CBS 10117 TaxID=1296121 RepID=A0A1A5ZW25_9TREE|nr:uncharacterized protein I303_07924 [Kwoniella dejecticola CBS 10117]OBR82011.1 hypothetical protein I303_07924 [Kwoniella dejecticola CBS 10117]
MQYLSKAYNYYSGINPATLSGAIDVIVVRHVDAAGTVTLSSSPFHVRFGKLQVLRAAEKTVTIRMPNNLPAPHVAPFVMKVGETGEAFFVVETDEQVPADLLTSPVVMPTHTDIPSSHTTTQETELPDTNHHHSLTQEPFGETEKQVPHESRLAEVEFLDLNAGSTSTPEADAVSSKRSSIVETASTLLPSIPMLSSRSASRSGSPPKDDPADPPPNDEAKAKKTDKPVISTTDKAPNPLVTEDGQSVHLPERDHTLANHEALIASENASAAEDKLPKIKPGQGEGPAVLYGKDVVLDMAGYHSSKGENPASPPPEDSDPQTEAFIQDLLAASHPPDTARPPLLPSRATDSEVPVNDPEDTPISSPAPELASEPDLPAALANMHISPQSISRRFDRGHSEPPQDHVDMSRSPTRAAMDTQWDWSRRQAADMSRTRSGTMGEDAPSGPIGRLKNVEENPYMFVLDVQERSHRFELSWNEAFSEVSKTVYRSMLTFLQTDEADFQKNRITFQKFIEDPAVVDDPRLVVKYNSIYRTWSTDYRLLYALSMYRRTLLPPSSPSLPSLSDMGVPDRPANRPSSGYGWSRWWRRGQSTATNSIAPPTRSNTTPIDDPPAAQASVEPTRSDSVDTSEGKQYAKTLRLSSDQLKSLQLKSGPNTIQFSVTSSYSGLATCTSRIFLWEETDQVVISDIDGTITKSDALGHVFAAIGRDWTHLGIAKLYTDIGNNGYKMLYLTSRAIGQADATRQYLKTITQGEYRLPEGPVIMSPDRLMASLHREVIMRKPELFKMACLRDIQRLFGEQAKEAFFAGFGNRITDAMSYRSVGIPAAKIYTIDSTGVVKTELLSAAGHKGSYIQLNDLVNEVFPPVSTKNKPEFTDFNYWRDAIPDIPLPDLSPPSPALSARSDTSGRLSVLGKITGIGRRSSKQPLLPTSEPSSRPSSPLFAPSMTPDELSEMEAEAEADDDDRKSQISMPGSFDDEEEQLNSMGDSFFDDRNRSRNDIEAQNGQDRGPGDDSFDDDDANFDDDILAAGEMQHVPF